MSICLWIIDLILELKDWISFKQCIHYHIVNRLANPVRVHILEELVPGMEYLLHF